MKATDTREKPVERFDYVIVGAGSAGCVMAARLSEQADLRVLLLEAGGGDWSPLVQIPLGTGKLVRSKLYSWGYETVPQPRLNDRRIHWPRGRLVGGSSSINSMIYMRGQAADYDHWRQLGNPGWSYESLLPYFRRSEANWRGADDHHGADGPLRVDPPRSDNPLHDVFVEAGCEAGYPRRDDFNGAEQEGFGRYDYTIHRGRRWSAATAYLHPALARPNLELRRRAQATRVLVEETGRGPRATGVEYARGGRRETVRAERGVLLCGGAINTPQVMLLSGIGAGDALSPHGIPVRHELPGVGENLQDHLDVPLRYACTQPITLHSLIRLDRVGLAMVEAQLLRRGPAVSFPCEGGAFLRSGPDVDRPDLQVHFLVGLGGARVRLPLLWRLNRGLLEQDGYTFRICQLRPDARGTIRLASADPLAKPAIDPNYLQTERDLVTLREGIRLLREVAAQPAFAPYNGGEIHPGPDVTDDAGLDAWVRASSETIYHPVGTARMGPEGDRMAVVDPQLRVHGMDGLWVVDASVMPTVISGNTNAPVMAIAEKAADMILGREGVAHAEAA